MILCCQERVKFGILKMQSDIRTGLANIEIYHKKKIEKKSWKKKVEKKIRTLPAGKIQLTCQWAFLSAHSELDCVCEYWETVHTETVPKAHNIYFQPKLLQNLMSFSLQLPSFLQAHMPL